MADDTDNPYQRMAETAALVEAALMRERAGIAVMLMDAAAKADEGHAHGRSTGNSNLALCSKAEGKVLRHAMHVVLARGAFPCTCTPHGIMGHARHCDSMGGTP